MEEQEEKSLTLYCFSPLVILITFLVEAASGVYALIRYGRTAIGVRASIFLFLLSLYQFAELMICDGAPPVLWARIGLIATAFLPILAIDVVGILTNQKLPLVYGYALAGAFAFVISGMPGLYTGAVCTGKFVAAISGSPAFEVIYGVYYLATLFMGVGLVIQGLQSRTPRVNKPALRWLLLGYISFMTPTFALYAIVESTRIGVGSILCGFALIVALIIVGKVLPLAHKRV